jgi:hypothetical protein
MVESLKQLPALDPTEIHTNGNGNGHTETEVADNSVKILEAQERIERRLFGLVEHAADTGNYQAVSAVAELLDDLTFLKSHLKEKPYDDFVKEARAQVPDAEIQHWKERSTWRQRLEENRGNLRSRFEEDQTCWS